MLNPHVLVIFQNHKNQSYGAKNAIDTKKIWYKLKEGVNKGENQMSGMILLNFSEFSDPKKFLKMGQSEV